MSWASIAEVLSSMRPALPKPAGRLPPQSHHQDVGCADELWWSKGHAALFGAPRADGGAFITATKKGSPLSAGKRAWSPPHGTGTGPGQAGETCPCHWRHPCPTGLRKQSRATEGRCPMIFPPSASEPSGHCTPSPRRWTSLTAPRAVCSCTTEIASSAAWVTTAAA